MTLPPRCRPVLARRAVLAVALLAGLLAACAEVPAQPAAAPLPAPAAADVTRPTMDDELQSRVQSALADAARVSGLAAASLRVVEAARVTWSDGSLGCPQPGRMYTQALVPGFRVRIQAGAQVLDYHGSTRGEMALCPSGRALPPVPGRAAI